MSLFRKSTNNQSRRREKPPGSRPTTFSYYARGSSSNENHTARRNEADTVSKRNRYQLKFSHIPSYVALATIVLALGYSGLLQPSPKIVVLNVPNTVHRDTKVYKHAVGAIWGKSIFNRTKFTVSTGGIRREIANSFPEIGDIQIELPLLGRRATVVLTPIKPALELVSVNGSFYVDLGGRVLAKTSDLQKNDVKDLPFIRDESGIASDPGKNIMPSPDAKFLQSLYVYLRSENVAVETITLPAGAVLQADVRVTGQQYYVKFSLDSDPRQAVGTYLASKEKLEMGGITPAEYLDVRVEEKVFYK